jgi:hypothetical protein
MPSRSNKQARYMAMIAHNPEKARKGGPSPAVAKEFNKADQRSGRLSKAMKGQSRGR